VSLSEKLEFQNKNGNGIPKFSDWKNFGIPKLGNPKFGNAKMMKFLLKVETVGNELESIPVEKLGINFQILEIFWKQ
jgi:hypothetical protein